MVSVSRGSLSLLTIVELMFYTSGMGRYCQVPFGASRDASKDANRHWHRTSVPGRRSPASDQRVSSNDPDVALMKSRGERACLGVITSTAESLPHCFSYSMLRRVSYVRP